MKSEHSMQQMVIDRRIAVMLLRDTQGRLLMQHRDGAAPAWPCKWGLPGGGIEPGETPEEAMRREVEEETGIHIDGSIALFWECVLPAISHPGAYRQWYVYHAQTRARQEDIVLGEGQAMVFTPLDDVLRLDLIPAIRFIIDYFLIHRISDGRVEALPELPCLP